MEGLHLAVSRELRRAGISREDPVLAAVSGGADSMALMRTLAAVGQRVRVGHVHHGARGAEADAESDLVRSEARALGLPFDLLRLQVPTGRPGSWEARAREARYAALERLRVGTGCAWIATGHSADDQAETVLMRASRGTRLEGLAGIEGRCPERRLIRPLLDRRRAELRAYLESRRAPWCEDPTNADPRQLRGQLRLRVIPELERLQPGAVRHLTQLASQARALREERRRTLGAWLARSSEPGEGGRWVDRPAWSALCESARCEVLALLLRQVCPPQRLTSAHLERGVEFLERARPAQRLSLPGGTVLCDREAFWIGPGAGPRWPDPFEQALEPGRDVWLPERGLWLHWRAGGRTGSEGECALWLKEEPGALRLRSPLVGDHLHRGARRVLLKSVLRAARFSLRERRSATVVADASRVLWVVGLPEVCALRERTTGDHWRLVAERVSSAGATC